MSYADIALLRDDKPLNDRVETCVYEQATIFVNDGRGDIAALADRTLRDPNGVGFVWMPVIANAPGFADNAADTSAITDGDLLAAVQANWPSIAALYYDEDGKPR